MKQPTANYLQIDYDACAPGMVNWFWRRTTAVARRYVYFSYKHELELKVVLRPGFLRSRFGKLRRKRRHRLGVWT